MATTSYVQFLGSGNNFVVISGWGEFSAYTAEKYHERLKDGYFRDSSYYANYYETIEEAYEEYAFLFEEWEKENYLTTGRTIKTPTFDDFKKMLGLTE